MSPSQMPEYRRDYAKAYYREHKAKILASNKASHMRHADSINVQRQSYRATERAKAIRRACLDNRKQDATYVLKEKKRRHAYYIKNRERWLAIDRKLRQERNEPFLEMKRRNSRKWYRLQREYLTDSYMAQLLRTSSRCVPTDLLAAKREQVRLVRLIRGH